MEIKRKTEIIVETKRRFVIEPPETTLAPMLCPECSAPMMQAEQLAALLGISRRRIYQIIESGARHFIETGDGLLCVCTETSGSDPAIVEKNR